MPGIDTQPLITAGHCYNCYDEGQWLLFRIGLELEALQILNPAVDASADAMLAAAKCYACLTPGFWPELRTALILQWAKALDPTGDYSVETLEHNSGCFACLTAGELYLAELGGLAGHVQSARDTSPDALLALTKCYNCLPQTQQMLIELGILKTIVLTLRPTTDTDPGPLLNDPTVRQIPPTLNPPVRTLIIHDGIFPRAPYPNFTWLPDPLPNATGGVAYSQALTTLGAVAPVAFVLVGGAFPPGVTISGAGVISGTPTDIGTFSFTIQATDSAGTVDSHSFSLFVATPVDLEVTDWVTRVIGNGGSVSVGTNDAANCFMFRLKVTTPTIRAKIYRLNFYAGAGFVWATQAGGPFVPLIKDKGALKDGYSGTTGSATYAETGPGGGLNIGAAASVNGTTGLIPNVDFPSTASGHVAIYAMSTGTTGFWTVATAVPAGTFGMLVASNQIVVDIFDGATTSGPIAAGNGVGFLVGNRSAAAGVGCVQIYHNGGSVATSAVAATGLPSKDWAPWIYHDDVPLYQFPWLGITGGYSIGLSLTGPEQLAFYNAWQEFQTALGRQV